MCAAIENPAKCEVRAVIRFFTAKGYSAAAIHRELCAVYGPKVMSEGVVREWIRLFKSGRENVHDEERSGRPSLVTDNSFRQLMQKFVKSDVSQWRSCLLIFHRFLRLFCTR